MPARILIVEDDDKVRSVFASALRGQGIAVDELSGADDAVGAIRSGDYSIVLLAPHAPLTNRLTVLDSVRNDDRRPVILMLSDSSEDVRRLAGDGAVMMCINKRFAVRNLEPVIAAIVAVSQIH